MGHPRAGTHAREYIPIDGYGSTNEKSQSDQASGAKHGAQRRYASSKNGGCYHQEGSRAGGSIILGHGTSRKSRWSLWCDCVECRNAVNFIFSPFYFHSSQRRC